MEKSGGAVEMPLQEKKGQFSGGRTPSFKGIVLGDLVQANWKNLRFFRHGGEGLLGKSTSTQKTI